jgi:hypothetical protein
MNKLRASLIALVMCLGATGCSSSGTEFTGVISTLAPRLCLAKPAAAGDCFEAPDALLKGKKVGDCVTVEYIPNQAAGAGPRGKVTKVTSVGACA